MSRWITSLLVVVLLVIGAGKPAFATGAPPGRGEGAKPGSWNTALAARLNQSSSDDYLLVLANGPVDLLVTDPQGRRVGVVSGQVVQEIPGTYYYGPHEVFEGIETEGMSIPEPLTGTYAIRVTGTDEGGFNLMVTLGSSQHELLLHDIAAISLGQVVEYAVEGRPQAATSRKIVYVLPVMKEVGERSTVLRLQNPGPGTRRVRVNVYDQQGQVDLYASSEESLVSWGALAVSLTGKVSLPDNFWGAATLEDPAGSEIAVLVTGGMSETHQMATEGLVLGAPTLYVPYLPQGNLRAILQVQNVGDASSPVKVTWHDGDGSLVSTATVTYTLGRQDPALYSTLYFFPAGFQGSAVVESLNGQSLVGAVFLGDLAGQAALYSVADRPAAALFVPQVLKGSAGLTTTLHVQNSAAATTTVAVRYYDTAGQPLTAAETRLNLSPHGAAPVALADNAALSAGFAGAAIIQSLDGAPLTAVALVQGGPGSDTLGATSALYGGSALLALPYLDTTTGQTPAVQVQNLGSEVTTATLRCYDPAGTPAYTATTAVAPYGYAAFVTATLPLTPGVYAAVVESGSDQPLAAFIRQQGITEGLSLYGGSAAGAFVVPPVSFAAAPAATRTASFSVTLTTNAPPAEIVSTTLWVRTPLTTTWATSGLVLTTTSGALAYTPTAGDGAYYFSTVAMDRAGNHEATPEGNGDTVTLYDTAPPSSEIAALPAYSMGSFTVTWSGGDETSGIGSYDVRYRYDSEPWVEWFSQTTATQAAFSGGKEGSIYYYVCRAHDRAGNAEEWPEDPDYDTSTIVDLTPPASSASAPDYDTGGAIPVAWTASDGLAGVASTELWVRTPLTTTWAAGGLVLTGTSGTFAYPPTPGDGIYFFGTVAEDWAGNREAAPSGAGDDSTVYDTIPPTSQVEALPAYSLATFTVIWSGSDATSGLEDYDVQVCTVDCLSGWSGWLTHTTVTAHAFTGSSGVTYSFRSRARDVAGNVESWPASADAATTVDTQPPETAVDAMPAYYTTTTFPVSWQGSDALSGLDHYDIYYCSESAPGWTLWLEDVTYTRTTFSGARGYTYHFCSRGVDNLGNAEDCPPSSTGTAWPIQSDAHTGVTPWSRVNDLPAENEGQVVHVSWSGAPGTQVVYDVQVRDGFYGMWLPWKSGVTYTSADFVGQYGHIYCFRSRQRAGGIWELYPLNYDTYTKLINPSIGGSTPPGSPLTIPQDEAPERMEEVTRTEALGTLSGYIAPLGDVDWYRYELTATRRLRITLGALPADFDVYVFDASGKFLWASTWGRQLPEEIVVRVPAGVYYVQLVGYGGDWSGELPYRLAVEVVRGEGQGDTGGGMGVPSGTPMPW